MATDNIVSGKVQELEQLIVIQPGGILDDQRDIAYYAKVHGNLDDFPIERIKHISEKAADANSLLRDAFNRILFFETAIYLADVAAVELKGDAKKLEFATKFLGLSQELLLANNYEPYERLVEAYKSLKAQGVYSGEHVVASNRAGARYLGGVDSLLKESKPGYKFEGNRQINEL